MNDRHILILLISIGIPLLRACHTKKESDPAESGEAAFALSAPPVLQATPFFSIHIAHHIVVFAFLV